MRKSRQGRLPGVWPEQLEVAINELGKVQEEWLGRSGIPGGM